MLVRTGQFVFGAVVIVGLLAAISVVGPSDASPHTEHVAGASVTNVAARSGHSGHQSGSSDSVDPATLFPSQPVNDGDPKQNFLYGWGTAQPDQMRATVHYGGTNTILSPERRALLGQQLMLVRAVGMSIGTVANAERMGYVKNFQRINGRGYEYVNWSNFTTKLNLWKPTVLAFEDDKPDSRIVSVAYNVLGTIQAGPPTDLPLEVIPWHYHSNLCEKNGTIVGSVEYDQSGKPYPDQVQRCLDMGARFRPDLNHWMVDLWVIPGWENPWGLVSSKHPDLMFQPTPWFSDSTTGKVDAQSPDPHAEHS